jgi:hypothetical protein
LTYLRRPFAFSTVTKCAFRCEEREELYDLRQVKGTVMATGNDPSTNISELPLTAFELPKWLVEPAVRSCRLFNTALDFVFYDVPIARRTVREGSDDAGYWR